VVGEARELIIRVSFQTEADGSIFLGMYEGGEEEGFKEKQIRVNQIGYAAGPKMGKQGGIHKTSFSRRPHYGLDSARGLKRKNSQGTLQRRTTACSRPAGARTFSICVTRRMCLLVEKRRGGGWAEPAPKKERNRKKAFNRKHGD